MEALTKNYKFIKTNKRIKGNKVYRYQPECELETHDVGRLNCPRCKTCILFGPHGFSDIMDRAVNGLPFNCPECGDTEFEFTGALTNLAEVVTVREQDLLTVTEKNKVTTDHVTTEVYSTDSSRRMEKDREVMVDEILGILNRIDVDDMGDTKIINILNYRGTAEEKAEAIKGICDKYKDGSNIICTTAYVSTEEFPEDKYYSVKQVMHGRGTRRQVCKYNFYLNTLN